MQTSMRFMETRDMNMDVIELKDRVIYRSHVGYVLLYRGAYYYEVVLSKKDDSIVAVREEE